MNAGMVTDRQPVARGYLYRGELIHEFPGGAALWPTWLVGARVDFKDAGEAEGFVDANQALTLVMHGHICPWCLEAGEGLIITVNECLVLSSHEACRAEAGKAALMKEITASDDKLERTRQICGKAWEIAGSDGNRFTALVDYYLEHENESIDDCVVEDVLFQSCVEHSTVQMRADSNG